MHGPPVSGLTAPQPLRHRHTLFERACARTGQSCARRAGGCGRARPVIKRHVEHRFTPRPPIGPGCRSGPGPSRSRMPSSAAGSSMSTVRPGKRGFLKEPGRRAARTQSRNQPDLVLVFSSTRMVADDAFAPGSSISRGLGEHFGRLHSASNSPLASDRVRKAKRSLLRFRELLLTDCVRTNPARRTAFHASHRGPRSRRIRPGGHAAPGQHLAIGIEAGGRER